MSFYFMLTVAVELRGAPFFGWIRDLSVADPLYITPILMGVTMFAQQRMSMSKVKDPTQRMNVDSSFASLSWIARHIIDIHSSSF